MFMSNAKLASTILCLFSLCFPLPTCSLLSLLVTGRSTGGCSCCLPLRLYQYEAPCTDITGDWTRVDGNPGVHIRFPPQGTQVTSIVHFVGGFIVGRFPVVTYLDMLVTSIIHSFMNSYKSYTTYCPISLWKFYFFDLSLLSNHHIRKVLAYQVVVSLWLLPYPL